MRLFDVLQNKKKILFVYTSEADIYNEQNNRYNDNYNSLNEIVKYIIEYNNFKILYIHTNKSFEDTDNIINFTINVPDNYMSDNGSTHQNYIIHPYRRSLTNFLKEIFNKNASIKVNLN